MSLGRLKSNLRHTGGSYEKDFSNVGGRNRYGGVGADHLIGLQCGEIAEFGEGRNERERS